MLFILSTQFLGNFQRLSDLLHQDFTRRKFRQVLGDLDSRLVELEKFDLFPIYQKTTLSDRTLQLKDLLPEEPLYICDHVNWVASCDTICSFGIYPMPVRFGGIYVPYATLFRAGAKRWKPATLHRGIQVINSHRFGFPFGRRFSIHRFTQMGLD